jgi:hypothetical protein
MDESEISLAVEIPAPYVVRRIKRLYTLWRNPVAQREMWYNLKWLSYEKYTKNPDLYRKRIDRTVTWSFPAGVLFSILLCVIAYMPPSVQIGPVFVAIVYIPLIIFGLVRALKRRNPNTPKIAFVPPKMRISNVVNLEKPDLVLVTPIPDRELFESLLIMQMSGMAVGLVGVILAFIGIMIGLGIETLIVQSFGLDPSELSFIFAGMGSYPVIFPPIMIAAVGGQFLMVGLGMRMNFGAAVAISVIVMMGLIMIVPSFIVFGTIMMLNPLNMQFDWANITVAIVLFLIYVALMILSSIAMYKWALKTFISCRRGRH